MKFRRNLITAAICLITMSFTSIAQDTSTLQPEPIAAENVARVAMLNGPVEEQTIINLTNTLRGNNNLGALSANSCLTLAARRHSQDMGLRQYFAHQAPAPAPYGMNFWDRAIAAGYTGAPRAENIAAGYASGLDTYTAWVTSASHLSNIKLADANEVGVGYAEVPGSPYHHYWTMMLGKRNNISCAMTAPPIGLGITGNTTVYPARPTFTWTYDSASDPNVVAPTWFHVIVMANGTKKLDIWISTANACGGDLACSYTPDAIALPEGLKPQGIFDLWVAGYNPDGGTVWSGKHSFSVNAGAALVGMNTPTQGAIVTTALVTLNWNNDPNAQWYRVLLNGPEGYKFDQWIKATDVCSGGTCAFVVGPTKQGNYSWWMTAWGPGGSSFGGQYNGYVTRSFTLDVQSVVVTGLSKDTSTAYTRVSWTNDVDASWYQVLVTNNTNGAAAYSKWYRSDAICFNTTCNVGFLPLVNGAYTLAVRGWGPAGMSNTASDSMIVSHGAPNLVGDARAPAHGASSVNGANLVLEWANDEDTIWYQVILNGPAGTVISKWYEARTICPGTCSLGPFNLSSGGYQWTMKGWGPGGTGSPAITSFTVQ